MPIYRGKYNKSNPWLARRIRGDIKRSQYCRTKTEAANLERKWDEEEDWSSTTTHTVSLLEWTSAYLDSVIEHVSYKEKKKILKRLVTRYGPDFRTDKFTPKMALDHITAEYRARTGSAARADLKHLKAAWTWGFKFLGMNQINPFLYIDPNTLKHTPKKRRIPKMSEFNLVMDVADQDQSDMLLAYICTAGRKSEIFNLRWSDVNFPAKTITLKTRKAKGGNLKEDELPMIAPLAEALRARKKRVEKNGPDDYVFICPKTGTKFAAHLRWLDDLCEKAGIKRFTYHPIRHLSASFLAKHKVPLPICQVILRHGNINTTAIYIHELEGMEEVSRHLEVISGGLKRGKVKPIKAKVKNE
jgi:integrase